MGLFSRTVKITKRSDKAYTSSLYAASLLDRTDINKVIDGQTVTVKKGDVPKRLIVEIVLRDGTDVIPLDSATEAEKEQLDEVLWYSNQGRALDAEEDKVFIKDFNACLDALKSGKHMADEEETEGNETEEETGPEGSDTGSEETGDQETGEQETSADLGISDEAFAALSQEEQIKFVEAMQAESEKLGKRAATMAQTVAKGVKRASKDDARTKQLFELLKTLVKPKDIATVEKLEETNTDPFKAAMAFFAIDLIQAEKNAKKKSKKPDDKPEESSEPKKKGKKKPDGEADEPDTSDESNEPDAEPVPQPATNGVLGAILLAYMKKGQMSNDDLASMREFIDVRKKYDLGEIRTVVSELGYEDDSPVMQELLSKSK